MVAGKKNDILFFKDIRGQHTEERGCLFRTPPANIRIDTGPVLRFPFAGGESAQRPRRKAIINPHNGQKLAFQ